MKRSLIRDLSKPLTLFAGVGIEMEYMIVDKDSLDIRPYADRLLRNDVGEVTNELAFRDFVWSNEFCSHVIEVKSNGALRNLQGVHHHFHGQLIEIEERLKEHSATLLGGAMHPWMDPSTESNLWPHGNSEVYSTFDRIFGCRGHGWANLQSVHINLPFANDNEFRRLHTAVRLLLPILPALSASSPFVEGRIGDVLDQRLRFYNSNSAKIPSIAGNIIPELVFSQEEYQELILAPIYLDLREHDPEQIISHEWVNARGAIARFDRRTIEIRIVDIQESPIVDFAVIEAVVGVLRSLCDERPSSMRFQGSIETTQLAEIYEEVLLYGDLAMISDSRYLRAFGENQPCTARELWMKLNQRLQLCHNMDLEVGEAFSLLLEYGPLARRLLSVPAIAALKAGETVDHGLLKEIYRAVAESLNDNQLFLPEDYNYFR